MASKEKYKGAIIREVQTVPFETAEEAWFWFIQAQQARSEGARFAAGVCLIPRPCEAVDILKIVDGLYRNRRLLRDHLLVLRHYGVRLLPPDSRRIKEVRAHVLWREAMRRMELPLVRKGIVRQSRDCAFDEVFWLDEARMAAE